jgi:hypothetical protein
MQHSVKFWQHVRPLGQQCFMSEQHVAFGNGQQPKLPPPKNYVELFSKVAV